MQKSAQDAVFALAGDGGRVAFREARVLIERLSRVQIDAILCATEGERIAVAALASSIQVAGVTLPLPSISPESLSSIIAVGVNSGVKTRMATLKKAMETDLGLGLARSGLTFDDVFSLGSRAYGKLVARALKLVASGVETTYAAGNVNLSDLASYADGNPSDTSGTAAGEASSSGPATAAGNARL